MTQVGAASVTCTRLTSCDKCTVKKMSVSLTNRACSSRSALPIASGAVCCVPAGPATAACASLRMRAMCRRTRTKTTPAYTSAATSHT